MFLTPEDIEELTGYKRGKDQCAWLEKKGWKFVADAHGRPKVTRSYCETKLGVTLPKTGRHELDFSAIA